MHTDPRGLTSDAREIGRPWRGRRTLAIVASLALTACGRDPGAPATTPVSFAYPPTRTVDVSDDYHGTRVADPYRWLESIESTEVRDWAAAQTSLAVPFLRDNAARPWLVARMEKHAEAFDQFDGKPSPTKGTTDFRLIPNAAGTHRVLAILTEGIPPRVLVDPAEFGADASITAFQVSPDERYVAYALSDRGSEWVTTRIRRVTARKDLPDVLDGLLFEPPVWTHDSRGFFYVHQQRAAPTERTMLRAPSIRYHKVDTPQSVDRVILQTPRDSTDLVLDVEVSPDGRYAIAYEGTGAHWEYIGWALTRVHVLDLRSATAPDVSGPLVALNGARDAAYRVVTTSGSTVFVLTDRAAPRRRLVSIDLLDPAPARWRDIISESTGVLESVSEIRGHFVAVYLEQVQNVVRVFDRNGRLVRTLDVLPLSTVLDVRAGPGPSELLVDTTSFLRAPVTTSHDIAAGSSRSLSIVPTHFTPSDYTVSQPWYTSKDGSRVPMFVIHRKGMSLDGSHPTIIRGYGASGSVMSPAYTEELLAWIEAGGVFAVPSLRGGGEFGRSWYEAAILDRKQTTIDDFIAAAEYLIAQRYTSSAKLAIQGASNGGQLVAATLAQRPDLFAAAIAEVPLTDNLRYDRGRHRAQFGSAADSAQFPFLFAYSPLHRVKAGTCYPATLITTAMNDDRAPAWHALKLTAALQAAQSCANPILLRADGTGGHAGNRGLSSFIDNAADVLSFAALRLGLPVPAAAR